MASRIVHWRTAIADRRGSIAVEFAFIVPPLILFLLGAIEGGRMLWAQNALQYAVEQAARCAVVDTTNCGSVSQIQAYAAGKTYSLHLASKIFSVTNPSCGAQVSANLPFSTITPIPITMTLKAKSCHPR